MRRRLYVASVHCCGPRWVVYVPALEGWVLTYARDTIRAVARQMITAMTGDGPESFELDLAEGQVFGTIEEFTGAHATAQRWVQGAGGGEGS